MPTNERTKTFFPRGAAVLLAALVLAASAGTAAAQAARTRPSGGSSASPGGGSSSGSVQRPSSSGGSSTSRSSGSAGSRTVIEGDRRVGGGYSQHRHDRHRGYSGYHHYPYYGWYPYSAWWGSPYWGWGPTWGWWLGVDVGPGPVRGHVVVYPGEGGGLGALDLDLWPAETQVWIDGEYVGIVDQFDGWPRYLWLEPGTYDVVFFAEGYQTLARQYVVRSGQLVDVGDRLIPGESVRPEDLASKSTVNRDERLARDREQRERAAAEGGDDWRARVRAERGARSAEAAPGLEPEPPAASAGAPLDARGEPGRLRLTVVPPDAAVYLDGRFLGTGADLAEGSGVLIDAGSHKLSIVHPGHAPRTLEFEVAAGQATELDVTLAPVAG